MSFIDDIEDKTKLNKLSGLAPTIGNVWILALVILVIPVIY